MLGLKIITVSSAVVRSNLKEVKETVWGTTAENYGGASVNAGLEDQVLPYEQMRKAPSDSAVFIRKPFITEIRSGWSPEGY